MKAPATSRHPLAAELIAARKSLWQAAAEIPDERWVEQPTPGYSPVGWHLGHVAAMQARWLLPGAPDADRFGALFDPFRTPKDVRRVLPLPDEMRSWLDEILGRVCAGLEGGRIPGVLGLPETFLIHHLAQHELQHAEHIRVLAALSEGRLHKGPRPVRVRAAGRLEFSGGGVKIGCDDATRAYDNERPPHEVELRPYWLDRSPVTAGEFARFVEAGGYRDRRFWTADGWDWRAQSGIRAPFGFEEQDANAPVTCLSWYEADSYARWRGARLPSEHEIEAAAIEPAGVWEWTSSWFEPYPGFRPYPYTGYSTPWFGTHRVLRGASWATPSGLVRPSLRNWYDPGFREFPSGFRCAGGL